MSELKEKDLEYLLALNKIGATVSVAKTQIIELLLEIIEARVDFSKETDEQIIEKAHGVSHLIQMSDEFAKKNLKELNVRYPDVSDKYKVDVSKLDGETDETKQD